MRYLLLVIFGVVILTGVAWFWSANFFDLDLTVESGSKKVTTTAPRSFVQEFSPIELVERSVALADGVEIPLRVAEGLEVVVAAENLGKVRFMSFSPDGRIFVPEMVSYMTLSDQGRIFILDDFNSETGVFGSVDVYLSGLLAPNNIEFYTDSDGQDWLYTAFVDRLVRIPYQAGDMKPSGPIETLATFPASQSPGADAVVWHITRTILFDGDDLYVSVGSGCNACEQPKDELRAVILKMNPDGSDQRVYADGIKNAVGLELVNGVLFATENGSDHLGPEAPDDVLFEIKEGANYGWPYCYKLNGETIFDDSRDWIDPPADCSHVEGSLANFKPHSAPLGVTYFDLDQHPLWAGSFLVALQGSFNVSIGNGYQVVRVSPAGQVDVLIDGFLSVEQEQLGRPVHIMPYDDRSFFVSDDHHGRIFYVFGADE